MVVIGLLLFGAIIIYKILTKKDRKDYLKKFKFLSYAFVILSIGLLGFQLFVHFVVAKPISSLAYIEADSPLAESIENHLKFEFPDKVESYVTLIYYPGHDGTSSYGQAEAYEISFELTPESFVEFESKFKGEYRHYKTVALENNNILVTMGTRTYSYFILSGEQFVPVDIGASLELIRSIPREEILKEVTK